METDKQSTLESSSHSSGEQEFTWDVFISYSSRHDASIAERINQALKQKGIRVWIDTEQIRAGDRPIKEMEQGLENSGAIAVLISPAALASNWVEEEYTFALTYSKEPSHSMRIIPVTIAKANVPGFLSTRRRVDFQDDSLFDKNIDELIRGIKQGGRNSDKVAISKEQRQLLTEFDFLWFFPEGMLGQLYSYLLSKKKLGQVSMKAKRDGLVRSINIDGLELMGAYPEKIFELGQYILYKSKTAGELLSVIDEWIAEDHPFDYYIELGIGRALLLRDLISLVQYLPTEEEADRERRDEVCQRVRNLLPLIVDEGHLRVGLEISKMLLSVTALHMVVDNLMYARLLQRVGEAGQAADIFDTYRGDNLFEDSDLNKRERFLFALDWAKALKDAGRAKERHSDIREAYNAMIALLGEMRVEGAEEEELQGWEADVRNNRATQIAQFGEDSEWIDAQEDFDKAAEAYQVLHENERFLATRANFVAQSLDRFDRLGIKAPPKELEKLLDSLDEFNKIAERSEADEGLFFFFYQKARLLKRLYPDDQPRALEAYSVAAQIAKAAGLEPRHAIAQRWYLLLKEKEDISEEEFLKGLRACAGTLEKYPEDAWSFFVLADTLIDIAKVLRKRPEKKDSWDTAAKAFCLLTRHFGWRESHAILTRLKELLKLMNGLNVSVELRSSFLSENETVLKLLLDTPKYQAMQWDKIAEWLKQ